MYGRFLSTATYQYIDGTTHSIINVVVSEYHGPVVQQSLHELGDESHKPAAVFFELIWLLTVGEQIQQARVMKRKYIANTTRNGLQKIK